ncbi:sulfite exporter TauE/SafE family protein 3 isoform X2 [Capsicum annuum]|uniref:sulfite exporter TauE/SafE family protein 3 isoform X2 n=2 Tax=Capsicum annuum TaxID=4072 RepID=UPI0007BEF419|nr:sulfite exporter TauE/SafE family protein 3 isoform X2 [Capsicum annuum]XP_047256281.1 sulfite exporter TauE/SafE family protein 3 isoform X2 [Capsicum annuum]XP_047256282.1 sulfite exporter TauE/SafE family protein 3 isoform X2 [Capsicum annuum]XP_047256283.1 sulfite exporter TauE/SafE family protein 3 isoform X2 [Capsicum annuum]XP_047256284.1 sulfite exporter TauE/SafE family protein 3 isoform X2 [Capsicum annuum]
MAEIGLRLKALTGYAVGVISFLVLAFALLASAEQILNGTSNDFESGSFFKLFNVLLQEGKMHYQHFWPELEFGWRVIVGSVIGFFAAAFGSVGGVGGGGIFVPMLTLITGFDPKTSTAISKCMITGAAGATVYYNLKLRHPILDLPIIDYDLSLLLQPMLLLGISIGVVLNILFAEWMVTVLLIILFIVTSTRSFFKGVETWKKETIIKKEVSRRLTSSNAGAEDAAYKLLPADPRVRNEGYKTPEVSIVDNVYWKDFIILIAVWVILLVLHFFKNYTSTCSTTYWILNLLQVPVAVGASGYEAVCLYKGTRMVMSSGEAVITWKVHQLILYCCCGILAGIVGGLLGLGGGFILGPLFLELGIPPQVSSATATFVMIFSSSMSVVQYYLLGRFPVPYALYFVAVATVAALAGQYVVRKIISIVGRASVIIFVLAFTIFVSALSLGGVGIADTIKRIKEGRYMGFDNICEYKP